VKKIFEKIDRIFDKIKNDYVSEYAAECAYFTILSFIPFIIIFITLIQFTSIDKDMIFFIIKEIIPTTMHDMILGIIDEVYSKSVATISVALVIALWSASKGFFSLSKGLRKIYNVKDEKTDIIVRLEGMIYTIIFIISIILFLFIMIFGNRINILAVNKFEKLSILTSFILKIRIFALVFAMFIVFLMIYKFIPKHKRKLKTQVYGAIFSSVAWYITSWFFSIYVDIFEGFSNTYGSLTSIILVMMWVYVCMYIVLIGGEINMFISRYKSKKLD